MNEGALTLVQEQGTIHRSAQRRHSKQAQRGFIDAEARRAQENLTNWSQPI